MSCKCNSALFCSSEALAACVREACDKGNLPNDWWQSLESAEECAQEWTAKTGVPHYVSANTECGPDAPVCATEFTLVSCPLDQVYKTWLESNADAARQCADLWNSFSKTQESPIHYEAKRIVSRLFSDVWQVVVK